MQTSRDQDVGGLLGALALALALGSCSREAAVAARPELTRAVRCAGTTESSRFQRQDGADGRETLRGETDVASGDGLGGRLHVTETATLDDRGRLLRGQIVVARPGASVARFVLDAAAGTVRVAHDGGAAVEWAVPADAPWIYRPALGAPTPVMGLVALRAAGGSAAVRLVDPARRESYLVPVDQVVVPTETGATVIVFDEAIDVDEDGRSVTRLWMVDRAVALSCRGAGAEAGS